MEIIRTIKYGDAIDAGYITPADLPAAWANFPAVVSAGISTPFADAFYKTYQNRQIAGETIPAFLAMLDAVTLETSALLPDGLYEKVLENAVTVEQDEERTRKYYPAPNGNFDTQYVTGGETETIKRKREYESELEKAEHLMREGLPVMVWVLKRYENCFLGVF